MYLSSVDFGNIVGTIKPLHGVNNGPFTSGFLYDTSECFTRARIPFARLHDTQYPFGGGEFIDVSAIFKNFDRDPDDPAAYDFTCTDRYLEGIRSCGTDIIYRLGVSIENAAGGSKTIPPMHIEPPKDYLKWAKICEHLIMHYNEGWADGFYMDIRYWEIWNEPESSAMWTGSFEEFIDFYIKAAKHLKNRFPKLKFGGYGSIGFYPLTRKEKPFDSETYTSLIVKIERFLRAVKENNAPLDFFSWHLYSADIVEFELYQKEARRLLDRYGFTHAESILDEWNMTDPVKIAGLCGAAYTGAVLCTLQEGSVDIANYYDARITTWYNGLFKPNGKQSGRNFDILKTFYTFCAFGELYRLGSSVQVSHDDGIYACAAKNGDEGAILLVNYSDAVCEIETNVLGVEDKKREITTYLLDETHDLERIKSENICGTDFMLYNTLKPYHVLLIKMESGF